MKLEAIFGPPGTGKTHTLVEIAEAEAKHSNVAYLSFSKAAATEALSRVKSRRIKAQTLHSLAYQALDIQRGQIIERQSLIKFSEAIGVPIKAAAADTLEETAEGDNYLSIISYASNTMMDPFAAYDLHNRPGSPARFEMFEESYRAYKESIGAIDFDDLLSRFAALAEVPRLPIIIVDEAQDNTPRHWQILDRLFARADRAYLAGDDDQAIFEWSGADPHGMVRAVERHQGEQRVLTRSVRIRRAVHGLVHEDILPQISRRVQKVFDPADGDAEVHRYGSIHEYPFQAMAGKDTLVLVRDRYAGLAVQRILNADLIPYSIAGGNSPFDNRRAQSIRAVEKLNRGEGITEQEQRSLAWTTRHNEIERGDYSHVLGRKWPAVIPMSVSDRQFYEEADLDAPITIRLSTIHQAKGREAGTVVLDLEMTDRVLLGIEQNRDAELRVMYVGCTRAKKALHLCGSNPLL